MALPVISNKFIYFIGVGVMLATIDNRKLIFIRRAPGVSGVWKKGRRKMNQRYKAVVESGSCSMDYKLWEERATCGHLHKTIDAAEKCREKKVGYDKKNRTCSALWYNSTIHNADGSRA